MPKLAGSRLACFALIPVLTALLLISLIVSPALAEDRSALPKPDKDYLQGYALDAVHLATSPSRFDQRDWIIAAGTAALIGAGFALDGEIKSWTESNRSNQADHLWDAASAPGDYKYALGGLGLMYAWAWWADDSKAARTALYGVESILLSEVLVTGVKFAAHRERPRNGDDSYDSWHGPSLSTDDLSMPSSHAAVAFALAATISEGYADASPWVAPTAYALAGLCAASRIALNEHWTSDVLVGSAIGYFTAKGVFAAHRAAAKDKTAWTILPLVGQDTAGAMALMKF